MTATAQAVLNVARGELGYREGPNNQNRYGAWYGMNYVPYCDIFLSWCAAQAGAGDIIPRSSYVPSRLAKAKTAGQVSKNPRVGSLACFDFNGDGVPDHIGIVEAVLGDGRIQTIEGNTASPLGGGSQADGGGVWRRNRSTSLVVGYIHPKYGTPVATRPAAPRATRSTGRGLPPLVVDGVWGKRTTKALQTFLDVTPVDGVKSRATIRAMQRRWLKVIPSGVLTSGTVKALQKRVAVKVDGALGRITVRGLQRYLNKNT